MEILFKGTNNYDLPHAVSEFARTKIGGLKKYIKRDDEEARAYVELGKETDAHQAGRIWRAEINFDIKGERFRAVALEESIEVAIDRAVNELGSELSRARERKQVLTRRGGATLKSMLRGFST